MGDVVKLPSVRDCMDELAETKKELALVEACVTSIFTSTGHLQKALSEMIGAMQALSLRVKALENTRNGESK